MRLPKAPIVGALFLVPVFLCSVSRAEDLDAFLAKEGADLRKAEEEIDYRCDATREKYLEKHMGFEAEFFNAAVGFIRDKRYGDAESMLESMTSQHHSHPDYHSRRADILKSVLEERKRLHGATMSSEKQREYISQLQEVDRADGFDHIIPPSKPQISPGLGETIDELVKGPPTQEEAELRKRYPNLCKARVAVPVTLPSSDDTFRQNSRKPSYEGWCNFEVRTSYATVLIDAKNYNEASKVVADGRKRFSDSVALKILEAGLWDISRSHSAEDKEGKAKKVQSDLLTLRQAELNCK